ncbi:hypothetical protein Tco_1427941 [Tanacetum coccineum]
MSRLSQSVHNDPDYVMPTTSPRQLSHKIHSYSFPFPYGDLRSPIHISQMIQSCLLHHLRLPTHLSIPILRHGGYFWGANEELSNRGSPRVIVYGYDGLPMKLVDLPSLDYVPGPEHPPSPDYMPGPKHPPSPIEVPYVPEPEYPEYLAPSDAEAPLEDQPLPIDASPTALSPGYVADSDPEDPKEDHADYPADGGDDDDEPFDDDDDTDDKDEEPFKDEEEEEHLALADSSDVPVIDHVPSAGDTEAFETNEYAPTPRSPQIRILFAQRRVRRVRKTVRLKPPMSPSMEARIAEYTTAPVPPSPPLSSGVVH